MKAVSFRLIPIIFLYLLLSSTGVSAATDNLVKESTSGICHAPSSRYYKRTSNYKEHNTLEQCFEAGGRPPLNDTNALAVYAEYLEKNESKLVLECSASDPGACLELAESQKKSDRIAGKKEEQEKFAGFRFGVGIALTALSEENIKEVNIDENGIINVSKAAKQGGSLMLEAHEFIWETSWGETGTVGIGPFLAITITDEEGADPFSSYAAGIMTGWKQPNNKNSWNIGLGAFVNTEVQSLRSGFVDGGMTTEMDPTKLLQTRDENGFVLMFSTTW